MNQTAQNTTPSTGNKPTHIVRKRLGQGKNADFETLGVAWDREDGSFYIKPYGTQIVEGGFYLFRIDQDAGERGAR